MEQTSPPSEELMYQLSHQISEQAKRLAFLEQYKVICETRIEQLSPQHPFPIKQEHIIEFEQKSQSKTTDSIQSQQYEQQSQSTQFELEFLSPDNLNQLEITQVFENYQKIYVSYLDLMRYKENLEQASKNEIMQNKQQKTYIEVLKQALESSLQENKMEFFIHKYGQESIDIFAEITDLKQSNELYKIESLKIQQTNDLLFQQNCSLKEELIILQKEKEALSANERNKGYEIEKLIKTLNLSNQQQLKLEEDKTSLLNYCEENIGKVKENLEDAQQRNYIRNIQNKEAQISKEMTLISNQLQEARSQLISKDQLISELENLKNQNEMNIIKFQQRVDDLQKQVFLNLKQQEQTIEQFEETKVKLEQKSIELEALQFQQNQTSQGKNLVITELKKENKILGIQLQELQDSKNKLQDYLEETKSSINDINTLYEHKLNDYQSKFQSEVNQRMKLEAQLQQSFSNNQILQQSLQQTEYDLQTALQDNQIIKEQYNQLLKEFQELTEKNSLKKNQIKDINFNQKTNQKQINDMHIEFDNYKIQIEQELRNEQNHSSQLYQELQQFKNQKQNGQSEYKEQITTLNQLVSQQAQELENQNTKLIETIRSKQEIQSVLEENYAKINAIEMINEKLEQQVSNLKQEQEQFIPYKIKSLNIEKDKKVLEQKLTDAQTQIAQLQEKQIQIVEKLNKYDELKRILEIKEKEMQNNIQNSQQSNQEAIRLKQKSDKYKMKLKNCKHQINNLNVQINTSKQDLLNVSDSYEVAREQNRNFILQIKELQRSLKQTEIANASHENLIHKIVIQTQCSIKQIQQKCKFKINELQDIQKLPDFVLGLVEHLLDFQEKLEQSEQFIENHNNQIVQIQDQISEITQHDLQLNAQNAELESQIQILKQEKTMAEIQNQQDSSDYQAISKELETVKNEMIQLSKNNQDLNTEVNDLHQRLYKIKYDLENEICGSKAQKLQLVILEQKIKNISQEKKQFQDLFLKCCRSIESSELRCKYSELYQITQDLINQQMEKFRLEEYLQEGKNDHQNQLIQESLMIIQEQISQTQKQSISLQTQIQHIQQKQNFQLKKVDTTPSSPSKDFTQEGSITSRYYDKPYYTRSQSSTKQINQSPLDSSRTIRLQDRTNDLFDQVYKTKQMILQNRKK